MLIVLWICLGLGAIFGILYGIFSDFFDGVREVILSILLGVMIGFTVWLLTMSGCILGAFNAETTPVEVGYHEIVSLKDNYGVNGYMRYRVSEDLEYVYMYEDGEKGLRVNEVDADVSYLKIIDEGEQPFVVIKSQVYKNGFLRFMLNNSGYEYEIHIPENAIVYEEYNVDLE